MNRAVFEGYFPGLRGADRAPGFLLRCRSELRLGLRTGEANEDVIVEVSVVGGGVPGIDADVHDFDILVLEEDMVVGFEMGVDGDVAAHGSCCGWGAGVFQFDFHGFRGGVVEVFYGVFFGFTPGYRAGGARSFRRSPAVDAVHVKVGEADGDLGGVLVHGQFLVGTVMDAKDADAVVFEFDFRDGGIDGDGVLRPSGRGDDKDDKKDRNQ